MRVGNGFKNFLVFVWGHYFMGLLLVVIFQCYSKMHVGGHWVSYSLCDKRAERKWPTVWVG